MHKVVGLVLFFCASFLPVYAIELIQVSSEELSHDTMKMLIKIELQAGEKAIFEESLQISHNDPRVVVEQQKILTASVLEYLPHVKRSERVFNTTAHIELILARRSGLVKELDSTALCIACIVLMRDNSAVAQVRMVRITKAVNALLENSSAVAAAVVDSVDAIVPVEPIDQIITPSSCVDSCSRFIGACMYWFVRSSFFIVWLLVFLLLMTLLLFYRWRDAAVRRVVIENICIFTGFTMIIVPCLIVDQRYMVWSIVVAAVSMGAIFCYTVWRGKPEAPHHTFYTITAHAALSTMVPLLVHAVCYAL